MKNKMILICKYQTYLGVNDWLLYKNNVGHPKDSNEYHDVKKRYRAIDRDNGECWIESDYQKIPNFVCKS